MKNISSVDLIGAAIEFAKNDFAVFPVHGIVDRACTCQLKASCKSAGKHPANSNGYKGATKDLEQIRNQFANMPYANIGIATGKISNCIVLDIDPRNGGLESIEKIKHLLPPTLIAQTGSGGLHFYYKYNEAAKDLYKRLGDGIDVQGDGRHVVAPPSNHISGGRYEWL